MGHLRNITKEHATVLLLTVDHCTVTGPTGEVLFDPDWGTFDMAVGDTIHSVYAGSADPRSFNVYPGAASSKRIRSEQNAHENDVFMHLRERLPQDTERLLSEFSDYWLLQFEMLDALPSGSREHALVFAQLTQLARENTLVQQFLETT